MHAESVNRANGSVVVTARAVNVAVGEFLRSSITDLDDFYCEA